MATTTIQHKTMGHLKKIDTIMLEKDGIDILQEVDRESSFPELSILPEYVVKVTMTSPLSIGARKAVSYIYFSEEQGILELYNYYPDNYELLHVFTLDCNSLIGTSKGFNVTEQSLVDCFVYLDSKHSIDDIKRYFLFTIDMLKYVADQLVAPKNTIKKQRATARAAGSSNTPAAPVKKKAIVLNADKVVYNMSYSSDSAIANIRSYQRRAQSWAVIGHSRKLKNGKTVWVKPYVKGTGTKETKQYKVL